jgi:hypothetical protein
MATLPVFQISDEQYQRILDAFGGDREYLKGWIHNMVIDQTLSIEANKQREAVEADIVSNYGEGREQLGYLSPTTSNEE